MSRSTEPYFVSKNSNSAEFSEIYTLAVRAIDIGIHSRTHPYHLVSVANMGDSGFPELRTVVLRYHNMEERFVAFHTDIRSPKIKAMRLNPKVSLLMYDPEAKIQLRLKGLATIHHKDPFSDSQWENTRPMSKYCYLTKQGSGSIVENRHECGVDSKQVVINEDLLDRVAYEHFAVVKCAYFQLDYTRLASNGHERAILDWNEKGLLKGEWVVV